MKQIIACLLLVVHLVASSAHAYTILVVGDSLSSAYGIPAEQGWVSLLGKRLESRDIEVVNQSISGETTYGGAGRISQGLERFSPNLVILGLGGNDALRGKEISIMRQNLTLMIQSAQDSGADVLLLGMKIPPNYGRSYAESFHQAYLDLSMEFDTEVVPFFLEPVATDYGMFLNDGIHPSAEAQPLLLDHIWPVLSPLLPD